MNELRKEKNNLRVCIVVPYGSFELNKYLMVTIHYIERIIINTL